jgi:tetratricopeptide (TPR) repeat protein
MIENVDETARQLRDQWLEVPHSYGPLATVKLHLATLDLANRFALSESVATPLEVAAQIYARMRVFRGATEMASRAAAIRSALCHEMATAERLSRHAYALDLLASIYRARGMTDAVTGCLVQLVEMHFACGNTVGVAWAVRELGAQALLAGDLDNAVAKLTRAGELYAEDGDDSEGAEERAECHVLLGRTRLAQGDRESALLWFKRAIDDFSSVGADALAREVEALQHAVCSSATELPAPTLLKIGDFGITNWE